MLLGKTIVIPEKNQLENPKAMANLILGYAVGFIAITPSRLGAYLADKDFQKAAGRLEKIICGGESISEDLISRLESCTTAQIYNQYGPSETCVAVSVAQVNGNPVLPPANPWKTADCMYWINGCNRYRWVFMGIYISVAFVSAGDIGTIPN